MPNFSVDRFESLRRAGKTYSEMEKILGVSRNTLKSYAHTHGVPKKGESKPVCALCGCNMNPRGKQRFCSDTWPLCLELFAPDSERTKCRPENLRALRPAFLQLPIQPQGLLLPGLLPGRALWKEGLILWIGRIPATSTILPPLPSWTECWAGAS